MSDTSWRELALQFDAQRMQALAHIRSLLADPVKHADAASAFLAAPPIPGEKVLAERLAENAETEKQLRRMLCVAYAGAQAYVDDGEASDSRCVPSIDFMRDTPAEIQHKMHQRSLTRMQEADQSSPIEWYPGITEKHFELAITRATATLTAERDRLKDALDEWLDKTYWVQTTATVAELGRHRADVLRARIEALTESKSVVATGWLLRRNRDGAPIFSTAEATEEACYANAIAAGEVPADWLRARYTAVPFTCNLVSPVVGEST